MSKIFNIKNKTTIENLINSILPITEKIEFKDGNDIIDQVWPTPDEDFITINEIFEACSKGFEVSFHNDVGEEIPISITKIYNFITNTDIEKRCQNYSKRIREITQAWLCLRKGWPDDTILENKNYNNIDFLSHLIDRWEILLRKTVSQGLTLF